VHTARRADKDHHGLLTNAAPEGPQEWPHLSHGPLSAADSTCCPPSARPPSFCSPPVKDGLLPRRPELSVSAAVRSLAWATQRGPRRVSVAAWPHPPSLAAAWAALSEEDEVAAAGGGHPASLGEEDSAGPGGGRALGLRRGLSSPPRLCESLLFSYPFSIPNRPKSKIYFNLDSPSPSESLGSTGGRGGRDMPAAPAGHGGRPQHQCHLLEHCGVR